MRTITDPNALLLHSADPGPRGSLMSVTPESADWTYCSLDVQRLAAGDELSGASSGDEIALIPLGGRCTVEAEGETWQLGERSGVFGGQP